MGTPCKALPSNPDEIIHKNLIRVRRQCLSGLKKSQQGSRAGASELPIAGMVFSSEGVGRWGTWRGGAGGGEVTWATWGTWRDVADVGDVA